MSMWPHPRWNSLRLRFLVAVLVWVVLGIGSIWFSATHLFAKHVAEQYHEELSVHIQELAGLAHFGPDGSARLVRPLSDPRYQVPLSGFYWQITVGHSAIHSPSMTRGRFDEEIAHAQWVDHDYEAGPTGPAIAYGMLRRTPDGRTAHFIIATDRRVLQQAIAGFSRELTQWLVALGLALIATGLAVVVFGLRPLDHLGRAVARLRQGDGQPLDGDYPAEVAPLVEDLNGFITLNRTTVERARVQAGNLAHALRTPLAVITDEAERLARHPEARASAETLLGSARVMIQQIDYHLAKARAATGAGLPGVACWLPDVLEPIIAAMRKLHPAIEWEMVLPAGFRASVPVDPVDLGELLSNLLDNAGKWASSRVVVILAADVDAVTVTVADDGPGMTDEQIAHACEIGQRFDETRSGSGLGLAIVRDIAEAWNLEFRLQTNAPTGLSASLLYHKRSPA